MGLWFSGVLGTSVTMFKKQWATQSGRSGSASTAANAGIPAELWGQHGDWHYMAAHTMYMKSDKELLLAVSRAAMRLPEAPRVAGRVEDVPAKAPPGAGIQDEEDVRTAAEPAGAPLVDAEDDLPPEVVGVPQGAFQWT